MHCMHACMVNCFSCVRLFVTLRVVACQDPLSMGFSRHEYWSMLPCPPPRDLPNLRFKPVSPISPALADGFFTNRATWEARGDHYCSSNKKKLPWRLEKPFRVRQKSETRLPRFELQAWKTQTIL